MVGALIRLIIDFALPTDVYVAKSALNLVQRSRIIRRRVLRSTSRGVVKTTRMGILDAATTGIKKGALAAPLPPVEGPMAGKVFDTGTNTMREESLREAPVQPTERIYVPGAYPHTPVPDSYKQSPNYTQNNTTNNFRNVTQLNQQPPPSQQNLQDGKIEQTARTAFLLDALSNSKALADRWLPGIEWNGTVDAVGYKTTPTRTVIHYALAVAFGLVKQQRVSACALTVDVDYENNHVVVSYTSKAYWLTELLTLSLYDLNGAIIPPAVAKDVKEIQKQATDVFSRSLVQGFAKGPVAGSIELGTKQVKLAGDAILAVIKAYKNLSRMLGPAGVYDMGDETLFGGRPSFLLWTPDMPKPFADMSGQPMLTRLPAVNPQPPVAIGEHPSTGYSLDLRTLVAQALYDPGIQPPIPDTNVSLQPVHAL